MRRSTYALAMCWRRSIERRPNVVLTQPVLTAGLADNALETVCGHEKAMQQGVLIMMTADISRTDVRRKVG